MTTAMPKPASKSTPAKKAMTTTAKPAAKPAAKATAKPAAKTAPAKMAAAAPKKAAPAKKAAMKPAMKSGGREMLLARVEAVRLSQREEGHFDCFARAVNGYCDQGGCSYHTECMSVSQMVHCI